MNFWLIVVVIGTSSAAPFPPVQTGVKIRSNPTGSLLDMFTASINPTTGEVASTTERQGPKFSGMNINSDFLAANTNTSLTRSPRQIMTIAGKIFEGISNLDLGNFIDRVRVMFGESSKGFAENSGSNYDNTLRWSDSLYSALNTFFTGQMKEELEGQSETLSGMKVMLKDFINVQSKIVNEEEDQVKLLQNGGQWLFYSFCAFVSVAGVFLLAIVRSFCKSN